MQKYYYQKIQFLLSWIKDNSYYNLLEAYYYSKDIIEIDKVAEA
jgi:hypothetical protein